MPSRPQYDTFTKNWNKTVNWAKTQNIPYSAYYPVYQLDAQRMLSGSPMSESERIRAIQASAGLNYSTSLPTDQRDWTNLPQNATRNAQEIFTGMEPQNLIGNIFDSVKNTIEHPSTIYGTIGDLLSGNPGAAGRKVLSDNNLLQLVPGVYDLAQIFSADPHLSGSKGFQALAENPITSVLDIVPFGRIGSEGLGRTVLSDSIGTKIGLTNSELRKLGLWRVGGKLIKAQTAPNLLTKVAHPFLTDATDTGWSNTPTFGHLWELYKQKHNMGSEQADVLEANSKLNSEGTKAVESFVKPAFDALGKLNPDEQVALTRMAQTDFRPLATKMADTNIPIKIRQAYEAAWDWWHQRLQIDMLSGAAREVRQPFNDVNEAGDPYFNPEKPPLYETYYVDTPQFKKLQDAQAESVKANEAYNKAAKPVANMLYEMDQLDMNVVGPFKILDQLRTQLYQSIQKSIPGMADQTAAERLHSTLPENARIEQGRSSAFLTSAERDSPTLRNLFGLPPEMKEIGYAEKRLFPDLRPSDFPKTRQLTLHQVNTLRDLMSPGGLLDKATQAYEAEQWAQMNALLKTATRKWEGAAFDEIPPGGILDKLRMITANLQKYASARQRLADETEKRMLGTLRGKKLSKTKVGQSTGKLAANAAKAHQAWLKLAIENPPDLWRNTAMDMLTTKLAQEEKTAASLEETTKVLSRQGWEESNLTALRRDPRTLMELMTSAAKGSLENDQLPDMDPEEFANVTKDTFDQITSMRARGEAPMYVHMLSPHEMTDYEPTYNVYVRGIKPTKLGSSKAVTWGYTPSVYHIGAGILESAKELYTQDITQRFIEQELMPRLHEGQATRNVILNYFQDEYKTLVEHIEDTGVRDENALALIERGLEKFNLEEYNPEKIFGRGFSTPTISGTYYINKDLARSFSKTIQDFQFPAHSIVDRGTKIFRFSILGLSPRYTAHILFGGSYMVALRAHPSIIKYLGDALYFARHGSYSEKTYSKFHPDFHSHLKATEHEFSEQTTEEGLATAQFHYATMNSAGRNWLIPEWLSRHGLDDTARTRIRAAADINLRFTRAIRKAQNAAVFLDGAARALKDGKMFYEDQEIPRQAVNPDAHPSAQVDSEGRNVYHPVTQKLIHDTTRSKVPMTPQQAHHIGMEAVADVMGNLRHMTPLERSLLTRVFPFYGWTKHILQYVLSYPFDHPYRAFIVSQLALQNSQDVASGLPLRIELLTFLGSPDQYGNVTALDTKSLDPFRDTANYASLTGLFESLNPAITGVGALVDPQFSFAGQNLYPQVTFNSLYGIKSAGAGGSVWNAAEQFVPQLTSLDAAFNLSGNYAYLKNSNPTAFTKKIFESFGLPLTPENLNLRQIAAKQEIDRYQIASNAAYTAATDPSSNALAGYDPNASIPDPLNTIYNVTPAYIAAMNDQSEKKYGLPFYETTTPPRTPSNL